MTIKLKDVRKIIVNASAEYNKYHSPEAQTTLLSMSEKAFKIKFTGTFCYTCGFYDYFDDFTVLLEEKGLNASVAEIKEMEEGAVVTFDVQKPA
jgi:hypothetical protein